MPDLRRSEAQNRKWRALLTDVSRCKPEGRELTPDNWSILLFAGWDHDRRFGDLQLMEGLEGRPPVPVNGYSTSLLTVAEMADLITFAIEYAERHGVRWSGGEHDIAADPVMQQHGRTARREPHCRQCHGPCKRKPPHGFKLHRLRDPLMRELGRG